MSLPKEGRRTDPDTALQRALDLLDEQVIRIEQKERARSPKCTQCGSGGEVTPGERDFLLKALDQFQGIAFKARTILTERMLRKLSQGQLEQAKAALVEDDGEWLPK